MCSHENLQHKLFENYLALIISRKFVLRSQYVLKLKKFAQRSRCIYKLKKSNIFQIIVQSLMIYDYYPNLLAYLAKSV